MVLGAAAVACGDSDASPDGGLLVISPVASQTATASAAVTQVPTSPTAVPNPLTGFSYPIAGGCLPKGDQLMPNAPRTYRLGTHEGVDFYQVDNCTPVGRGTEVVAAKAGRVIRADLTYQELTPESLSQLQTNSAATEEALDKFRGRQVWVEHQGGIVTRYAHLSGVAPGISVGATVTRGLVVGYVGESGTPESVSNPGSEYHLHFEVRIGDGYLGKGLSPAEVRRLYEGLFAQ